MDKQKNKMASNDKPSAVDDCEEIRSIPDSFENGLFTDDSNSVIISTNDGLQSNKRVANSSAQTSQKPRFILQYVSTHCAVSQKSQSPLTEEVITNGGTVVANQSSHSCETSNCCFHKFSVSIPCNSYQPFLKSLKNSPLEVNQTPNCVPNISKSEDVFNIGHKRVPKNRTQTSSTDSSHPISSVDTIPQTITSQLTVTKPKKVSGLKKQIKPKAILKKIEDKTTIKGLAENTKSKSKRTKAIDLIEETNIMPSIEQTKNVVSDLLIKTGSSVDASQLSGAPEVSVKITNHRIKGLKSQQKKIIENISEELKKKPKVHVLRDDKVVEELKSEALTKTSTESKNKNKTNRKIVENKKELNNIGADTATENLSTNSSLKQTKIRKQTAKRTGIPGQKASNKNLLKLAEELAKNSNTENDLASNHETITEPNQSDDTNQRTKRKTVPKKRFAIEDSKNEEKQTEEKPIDSGKNPKYKPIPKPSLKQVLPLDVSVESAIKNPISPTHSVALSETSTNSFASHNITSSTEWANKKKAILFSRLDEKQQKMNESICLELKKHFRLN